MSILNYYLTQQRNPIWYQKFQSTSSKQSGKTFSYVNTNFRYLLSFIDQFEKFKSNFGKERKDWSEKLPCGQELDKHRVINLLRAGLITTQEGYYYVTPKGMALMDLAKSNLKDADKWILLFLLLIDYKSETRKFDVLRTAQETFNKIVASGVNKEDLLFAVRNNLTISEKERLFEEDVFWLVSFVNDLQFLTLFNSSTEEEKKNLKEYVKNCSHNKDSKDLIAHKFVSSGAYNCSMFRDDLNVIYFSRIVIESKNLEYPDFFEKIVSAYSERYRSTNKIVIMNFINNHKSIYESIRLAVSKEDF